jgi:hypothetical protein
MSRLSVFNIADGEWGWLALRVFWTNMTEKMGNKIIGSSVTPQTETELCARGRSSRSAVSGSFQNRLGCGVLSAGQVGTLAKRERPFSARGLRLEEALPSFARLARLRRDARLRRESSVFSHQFSVSSWLRRVIIWAGGLSQTSPDSRGRPRASRLSLLSAIYDGEAGGAGLQNSSPRTRPLLHGSMNRNVQSPVPSFARLDRPRKAMTCRTRGLRSSGLER